MDKERFDWYLSMLRDGQTVSINGYIYGDFLRYVSSIGLENEFAHMKSEHQIIDDIPIVNILLNVNRSNNRN